MLVSEGRLDPGTSPLEFMNPALTARAIAVLPITAEIAELSTKLPERVSPDSADRLIAATVIHPRTTLISTDTSLEKARLPLTVVG